MFKCAPFGQVPVEKSHHEVTGEAACSLIAAEDVISGEAWPKLAREHAARFRQLLGPERKLAPNRTVTWGSACSGSNADLAVAKAMISAYRDDAGLESFDIDPKFFCEIAPQKSEWCQQVEKVLFPESDACGFGDFQQMRNKYCDCKVHGRCEVPSVDVFVCCTSCKDMTRWSGSNSLVLAQSSSPGGSAQTFHGLLGYISVHRPAVLLFENVDTILEDVEPDVSNFDVLAVELSSRGYEHQSMIADTHVFGLLQRRRRMYLAGVLTDANPAITFESQSIDAMFGSLRSLIRCTERKADCASKFLYPPGHSALENELNRRIAYGERASTYNAAKTCDA